MPFPIPWCNPFNNHHKSVATSGKEKKVDAGNGAGAGVPGTGECLMLSPLFDVDFSVSLMPNSASAFQRLALNCFLPNARCWLTPSSEESVAPF